MSQEHEVCPYCGDDDFEVSNSWTEDDGWETPEVYVCRGCWAQGVRPAYRVSAGEPVPAMIWSPKTEDD